MNTVTPNFAARLEAARSAAPSASASRATPDGAARPVEDDDFSRHLNRQGVDQAAGRGARRVSLPRAGESAAGEESRPARPARKADAADPGPADGKTLPPDLLPAPIGPPLMPLAPPPVASGTLAGALAGPQAAASLPSSTVGSGPTATGIGSAASAAGEPAAIPATAPALAPTAATAPFATEYEALVGAARVPPGPDGRSPSATTGSPLLPATPLQPGAPGSEPVPRPGSTGPASVVGAAATAGPVSAATAPAAATLLAVASTANPPAPVAVADATVADGSADDRPGAPDGEQLAGPDGPGVLRAGSEVAAPAPDRSAELELKADGDRDLKVKGGNARMTGHKGAELADLAGASLAVVGSHAPIGSRADLPNAPAVTVPLDSPDWGQKVAESVHWAVNQNLTHAQISLNPDHLGPLEIRLSLAGNEATVWFGTHSHAAADALAASSGHLRSLLGQAGFAQVNVDVSRQSGQQSAFAGSSYRAGRSGLPAAVTAEGEPLRAPRSTPRSVLDAYA
jgi:flagellar hook-length control protein FliK